MQMPFCGAGVNRYHCNVEAHVLAIVIIFLLVALVFVLVWVHNHNNHRPWKLKCGWVKIDGLWHFFSRKVTKENPCLFGGGGCNAAKCAKGVLTSKEKINFYRR